RAGRSHRRMKRLAWALAIIIAVGLLAAVSLLPLRSPTGVECTGERGHRQGPRRSAVGMRVRQRGALRLLRAWTMNDPIFQVDDLSLAPSGSPCRALDVQRSVEQTRASTLECRH